MRLTFASLAMVLSLSAAAPPSGYADARACAACHRKIDESWRQTGMGRSLYRPSPANTVEDYRDRNHFLHTLTETHYSMTVRDGAYYQRRWQTGFDGKETNVDEWKIDYVIGSGNHARSYLNRRPGGGYMELPLSWYPENGGSWAMSPGFDQRHPPTHRFASYECIFCHDAIPRIPAAHEAPDSDPVFFGDLPEGIDCQRCHGPGAKHVSLAGAAGAKPGEIRASIVNPARLPAARRMDICMQCHLEPASDEIPSLMRRFNRGPFSFRPGEPLSAFLLVFDHAPGAGREEKFQIVNSSAYRLRQSPCFLKSNGTLLCETCHDPHRPSRGAEPAKQYTAACLGCHGAAFGKAVAAGSHPAATECTGCHMPKRRTEDVVHAVMTDHRIQRRPPPGDPLAPLAERHPSPEEAYRGEVVPFYPAALPPTGENLLYQAVAQVVLRSRPDSQAVAALARQIDGFRPREPAFYNVLGGAWQKNGQPRQAAEAYRGALRLAPDSVRALLGLAAAQKALGQLPPAAETLNRALSLAPASALAWFQSGVLDFTLGNMVAAIPKMEKALLLDPDLTGGRNGLAELLWRAGQAPQAEQQLREALRMDPWDASAYNLLGRILAGLGQTAEALFDFEKATRLRPGYAPALYDYALQLSALNRLDEAQTSVEAALRADPALAEAHVLLGGMYAGKRQLPEAAREYLEALRLRPDFARAHLDLARVLAAQGDLPAAIEHLRQAAAGADPQVAQLAAQALRNLARR